MPRMLSYGAALAEALMQEMERDPAVYLIGQGVNSPWYVGNSTKGILERFGPERVIDTPVAENAETGIAIGSAMCGMKPVVIHPRMDFCLLALEQIVSQAANWSYMFDGQVSVPVCIRPIINRGGEQAAQHSQALHAHYAHIPGLKVVMPATARDAKGLLIAAIRDPNPVVFIDDRWLYAVEGDVPEEPFAEEIGVAKVLREGKDLSIVAVSYLVQESLKAADQLAAQGISAEVLDVRTVRPLDERTILESLARTGRMVVADSGWSMCGVSAEIAALAAGPGFGYLRAPVERVTLPPCPAPMCKPHEEAYFPRARHVVAAALRVAGVKAARPT
ncbi:MAG: pyruvate dehydrogenase complex E1 component subunit beta [Planctomycetota bacterium]|nr:pyruvate dehydrogenase complex E1 component subunit beta [Planctomycetota bacterium]